MGTTEVRNVQGDSDFRTQELLPETGYIPACPHGQFPLGKWEEERCPHREKFKVKPATQTTLSNWKKQ